MYEVPYYEETTFRVNTAVEGEPIELKIERIVNNKEPITDGAPIMYTERKEGIKASTNIRTDRWEVAVDAMDKIAKSYKAKREERMSQKDEKDTPKSDVGKPESTQGTAA